MLDRLIGLETEYAVRFRVPPGALRPTDRELFDWLTRQVSLRLPIATADDEVNGKPGVFLANGAAVWFESRRPASGIGLIEGSTPECRGPRTLLAHQRALDRLLSDASAEACPGQFSLYKNCRDSAGASYGAQENYEAVLATGWRLRVWRIGAVAITISFLFVILCAMAPLMALIMGFNALFIAPAVYAVRGAGRDPRDRQTLRERLYGRRWFTRHENDSYFPVWIEAALEQALRLLALPGALALSLLFATTQMHRTQRRLLPFLLTRMIWAGAGWIAPDGKFHIAEKATSRTREFVHALIDFDKPIFGLGQFLKPCLLGVFQPHLLKQLLSERQRLQIGIGDSNLCEEAEYLRIGATALVLDAIEAGAIVDVPQPRRLWRMLRGVSLDTSLTQTYRLRDGRSLTALQIQRFYLNACRRYVHSQANVPEEAWDILARWATVLDDLEDDRSALVGRVDWVTKQFLLAEAGAGLPADARKKIDLRYHELSREGYFSRLQAAQVVRPVLAEREVEQAMRWPPSGTRAMDRGRYIREFSAANQPIKVSWGSIQVGVGASAQRIPLPPESRGVPAASSAAADEE